MPESKWRTDLLRAFPDWQSEASRQRWPMIKASLQLGQAVEGRVVSRAPFGVWVDIDVDQPALLLVVRMRGADARPIPFDDYPKIGTEVTARILVLGEDGEIGLTQLTSSDPAS